MLTELTQPEIEVVLSNNYIGRIGCRDDESVHIATVFYQFHKGYVQCFSLVGDKIKMMRKYPDVCFEVEEIKDADDWKTVICWGRYEEITNEAELAVLRPQYSEYMLRMRASLSTPSPEGNVPKQHSAAELAAAVIYRIRFTKLTGRVGHVL